MYTIKGVNVRVIKEEGSGVTEIFFTKMGSPVINFSEYVQGDADIKSGVYDFILQESPTAVADKVSEPEPMHVVNADAPTEADTKPETELTKG